MFQYRPLPEGLTIKNSNIEGLGLFTNIPLKKNTDLGISHVLDDRFPQELFRTPLVAFCNHSDSPNCMTILRGDFRHLITLRDILPGEELTTNYKLNSKL